MDPRTQNGRMVHEWPKNDLIMTSKWLVMMNHENSYMMELFLIILIWVILEFVIIRILELNLR